MKSSSAIKSTSMSHGILPTLPENTIDNPRAACAFRASGLIAGMWYTECSHMLGFGAMSSPQSVESCVPIGYTWSTTHPSSGLGLGSAEEGMTRVVENNPLSFFAWRTSSKNLGRCTLKGIAKLVRLASFCMLHSLCGQKSEAYSDSGSMNSPKRMENFT